MTLRKCPERYVKLSEWKKRKQSEVESMFYDQVVISPRFRPSDYLGLNLVVDSPQSDWEYAIEIFIDRIKGRHLDAIELLIEKTREYPTRNIDYSFSIMALMCLIIETLHQFYNGIDETERYYHRDAFVQFLITSPFFRESFHWREARSFYSDIRNGILHQAQTKKQTQLTILSGTMVEPLQFGIRVDVIIFYEALKKEIDHYITRLLDPNDIELREKFITKMGFIVRGIG